MAFPSDPLPLTAELRLGTAWVDITDDVLTRDGGGIEITRGRPDEGARTDPARAVLQLRNADGRYSPRNPSSPYYGLLGRNTPIRLGVRSGPVRLVLPGDISSKATCPDSGGLDITGDLDVRVDLDLADWRREGGTDIAAKFSTAGDQRAWALYLHSDGSGRPVLTWSSDGTFAGRIDAVCTLPIPAPAQGRQAMRATLDVNNGAGGWTVHFYAAPTIAGPWEQLGEPVTGAGTTSIAATTAQVELGDAQNLTARPVEGAVYAMQVLDGIDGTPVIDLDFSEAAAGSTSVVDATGNTWTVQGDAEVTDRRTRLVGEVSSWPARWDTSGRDVWVEVEASGIQRRLGQGAPVKGSVMYRALTFDAAGVVAYWPLEDPVGSTSLAAGTTATPPMQIVGAPELAAYEEFTASAPLPVLGGAQLAGQVPSYEPTGLTQVRWIMAVPASGDADNEGIVTIYTSGSLRRWECHYGTGGTLGLRAYDSGGTLVFDTGDINFGINGIVTMVSVELTQDGADVDWLLGRLTPGESTGSFTSGTATSHTVGRVESIIVNPNGGLDTTAIGHVSVQTTITSFFDLKDQMVSWVGETAGRRIVRLCREEGIPCWVRGDVDTTTPMGAQRGGTLLELLEEAAQTDGGILYEARETAGLAYRTRESLYNQQPAVLLDYGAGHLVPPLDPTDDDQALRNDITVRREEGSSARAELQTGPVSVLPPPDGVGRYDEEVTINPRYDSDLPEQATWRLHLGTVDEQRYPVISLNLARLYADGADAVAEAIAAADIGDLITITGLPSWLPPGDVAQLVMGGREFFAQFDWLVSLTCAPASGYQVAAYDVQGRYGPVDTVLADDLDDTTTTVVIDTPTGPLWDTAASGYDVLIGGERMTVSAVGSPSSTEQTLTVVRSVNGVVKTHPAGTAVVLAEPAIYAL